MPERPARQSACGTNPLGRKVWDEARGGRGRDSQGFGGWRARPCVRLGPKVLETYDPVFLKLFLKKGEKVGIFRDAGAWGVIYLVAQAFLIFPTFLEVPHRHMSS